MGDRGKFESAEEKVCVCMEMGKVCRNGISRMLECWSLILVNRIGLPSIAFSMREDKAYLHIKSCPYGSRLLRINIAHVA